MLALLYNVILVFLYMNDLVKIHIQRFIFVKKANIGIQVPNISGDQRFLLIFFDFVKIIVVLDR